MTAVYDMSVCVEFYFEVQVFQFCIQVQRLNKSNIPPLLFVKLFPQNSPEVRNITGEACPRNSRAFSGSVFYAQYPVLTTSCYSLE